MIVLLFSYTIGVSLWKTCDMHNLAPEPALHSLSHYHERGYSGGDGQHLKISVSEACRESVVWLTRKVEQVL